MKRLLAAALLLLSFAVEAEQVWLTILGPQNVTVKRNLQEYGPMVVPSGPNGEPLTALHVRMSVEDWPRSQPVTVTIYASFDGGVTWPLFTHATAVRPAPEKDGSISPIGMGIGWNEAIRQATHVKATTDNPGPAFNSTVLIEGLTAF